MTVTTRKLVAIASSSSSSFKRGFRNLSQIHCSIDQNSSTASSGKCLEFTKWHNGGGLFHKSACIDPTALIEVGALVHSQSHLGPNVHIGSGTVVGPGVSIGESTKIGYNSALSNCSIGDSCVIHNGACVGQDGCMVLEKSPGFPEAVGHLNALKEMVSTLYCTHEHSPEYVKLLSCSTKPQHLLILKCARHLKAVLVLGKHAEMDSNKTLYTRIGNHVEIGANTCIDRGSWRDTVIGDYTKIDNLVQIGHNVVIGKCCMLCGQVGIAGSVTIGDYVTLGGRVAIRDHVSIGSKVRLAANSSVTRDIKEPGDYGGFPAIPIHEWRRQVAAQLWKSKNDAS